MRKTRIEELDMVIPDMDTEPSEEKAGDVLRKLPGVEAVRIIQRGAWASYDAAVISREEICSALRHAGFRASTFQDSKSGHTGFSSI